ncbi:MAG: OmpA family protein [Spirochaetes bacterium]|nr:OmpA family protein [Spirochaetota bacterium]
MDVLRALSRIVTGGGVVLSLLLFYSCSSTGSSGGSRGYQYSEYSPTISADGRTMIYQADIDQPKKYQIYAKQKVFDKWSKPMSLDSINSKYNDGGCFITYDQNALIFTSDRPGGLGNCDLWISQRQGERWSEPVNMGAPINSPGYDGFASLSPDGTELFFVRECPEKKGCAEKLGIYYAKKVGDRWTEPKKMPAPINTDYCEFGPVILADNLSLIFSSTRPGGSGGYDLYKVERTESGGWGRPINLGGFINTKGEDSLIAIPASGEIMYYTKSMSGNEEEKREGVRRIFSVPIPENLQQTKVVIVKGTVRDKRKTDKTLFAEIAITDINSDARPKIIYSNRDDGKYIVILNKGKICDFSVRSSGYLFYSRKIDLTDVRQYKEINEDILLEPIVVGANIVLNTMYFEFRKYGLLKESKYELNRIIKLLNENPTMRVEISGHTDNIGSDRVNQKLSEKRARSVVEYLVKNGIARHRLEAKGYGKTRPIATNKSEEGRQENRRVEIEVLSI